MFIFVLYDRFKVAKTSNNFKFRIQEKNYCWLDYS